MRILIAEGEKRLGATLARGLSREGHRADLTASGEDAIRMTERVRYDVILIDTALPGLDGFATCRALRSSAVTTPVILMTGGAGGDRTAARLCGADDFLEKPFPLPELIARARALAPKKPGSGGKAGPSSTGASTQAA